MQSLKKSVFITTALCTQCGHSHVHNCPDPHLIKGNDDDDGR